MPKINLNLTDLQTEKADLNDFLAQPNAYADPEFSSKNKRLLELQNIIEKVALRESLEAQIVEARELASGGGELADLARMEIDENTTRLAALEEELFALLAPKDPNDEKNVIVEIRAGAGGDDQPARRPWRGLCGA